MSKQSMGDLFLQQRRERAASSAPASNLTLLSSGSSSAAATTAKPKSFAEIQREQQQEQPNRLDNTFPSHPNNPRRTNRPARGGNSNNTNNTRSPIEQGVIHTLLDKFGFIHCADRPVELFFHCTSTRVPWDDLNIGDEVEFRVGYNSDRNGGGGREGDKLKAFDVRVLPADTVVWEKEDVEGKRYGGKVKSIPRENGRDRIRGTILVDGNDGEEVAFTNSDCPSRLGRNDTIEFSIFTERRTGMKLARNIHLIQSEKERLREEREAKLLENATVETGIVVRDKGDFGFIKCVNRREDVHFNVSQIVSDVEQGRRSLEGQEVEFYVVDESQLDGGGGRKKSGKSLGARKIKFLPKGSVKFEHVLGEGVTGVVVECPIEQGTDGFGRSGGGKKNVMGKIRLEKPVKDGCSDDDDVVAEVMLQPDLYPGGTYAMNRVGSEMGSWIRPGDILLFDVIQTIADGKIRAVPTKHTQIESLRPEGFQVDDSTKPAVRLVELVLMGRTEGVVRSIRDDYAFIHCAERNVDAYMKLYEIFPNDLHADLILNNPELKINENNDLAQERGRIRLEVGMEVSFDLSVQMISNSSARGGGRGNMRSPPEKDSLRARRVQILPKGTVLEKLPVASGVKATVIKEDKRQQFVGTIELEESITVLPFSRRYPLVAKLLDYIEAGRYGNEVVFNEVMSEKDAQTVISMVNARDNLQWKYTPLDGENVEDSHNRKLCIVRRQTSEVVKDSTTVVTDEEDAANETEDVESHEAKATEASADDAPENETSSDSKKKKSKGERVIRSLRYDRVAFPDLSVGTLGVGDVITCDLFLSRSSGQVHVENISVIERKERPVPEAAKDKRCLTGYVTEVVSARQFGFITGIDESGSKTGDHVFFHFKTVSVDDLPQDASPTKKFNTDVIRKGDEVKFDAEPGKNGKLTATSITILPRGTLKLPNKVDKSTACTGYILLEPSHTSLANTPSHMVVHSGPALDGAGRWDNVGKEPKTANVSGSNIKEEGVILLLSDPSYLFSPKPQSDRKSSIDEADAETKSEVDSPNNEAAETAVCTHVRYKASSLAFRFSADNPDRPDGPRRGDLVVFGKTKGAKLVKDIRIEKLEAATTVKGNLIDIKVDQNTATFVSANDGAKYNISLSEVVSCEKSLLKENEEVNGVLHEEKIFGGKIKDIFLTSSLSKMSSGNTAGPRQRPKLNLTVKKELQGMGGQIMAQSKMAKGPDGTNGFAQGWTKRLSPNVRTFVPANIPDSGFVVAHSDETTAADE